MLQTNGKWKQEYQRMNENKPFSKIVTTSNVFRLYIFKVYAYLQNILGFCY